MRMTDEAKPSEAEASENELSLSVIPIWESKEEEKTLLVLSSALAELVVDSEEDNKFQVMKNGTKGKWLKSLEI